eukprot:scaffold23942_cov19-Tisochrysis_lutea.AAC.1
MQAPPSLLSSAGLKPYVAPKLPPHTARTPATPVCSSYKVRYGRLPDVEGVAHVCGEVGAQNGRWVYYTIARVFQALAPSLPCVFRSTQLFSNVPVQSLDFALYRPAGLWVGKLPRLEQPRARCVRRTVHGIHCKRRAGEAPVCPGEETAGSCEMLLVHVVEVDSWLLSAL